MPSAIETFRAQREAIEQVQSRLLEVSRLLTQLSTQATTLAADKELRAVLQEEQRWLAEARQMVAEVRYFRQSVDHRWPAQLRRWVLPILFALASATAAGIGHGVLAARDLDAVASLRARASYADAIHKRLQAMTPAERRQFERLIRPDWSLMGHVHVFARPQSRLTSEGSYP
jgi:hypothetical protein